MSAAELISFLQSAGASAQVLSFVALTILVIRVTDLEKEIRSTARDTARVIRRINHLLGKMGERPLSEDD